MKSVQIPSHIPSYNLYGEMGDLPDVVHCETISTRAVLHNWRIKPHRHSRLHQFFLVQSGGGTYNFDGAGGQFEPPTFLNIPPRTVHEFAFIDDTKGHVITAPLEIFEQNSLTPLRSLLTTPFCGTAPPDMQTLFEQAAKAHAERRYARAHILQSLVMLIAGQVAQAISEAGYGDEIPKSTPLFARFEDLLELHFCDHWTLTRYAATLAVTSTHLTRVTKKQTGIAASKLLEDRLMREARRNLAYTSLTIAEIAYRLGYVDPAYFSRVFSRATGLSPKTFRLHIEAGAG